MSDDLLIRRGHQDDTGALSRMLLATWHDTYDSTIGAKGVEEISARWHSPAQLMSEMVAEGLFLVALSHGEISGHSYSSLDHDGVVKLQRLYVAPQMQGRGIGARLLHDVVSHYPGKPISLEVHQNNPAAIRFYVSHGFAITGKTGHCGGDSDAPAFIMERKVGCELDLTVRPAWRSDVPAIVRLLADDMLGKSREAAESGDLQTYYDMFGEIERDARNELIVAERAGEVVGTYQVTYIPYLSRGGNERALIEAVRVSSHLRGMGVGRMMMQHAIDQARQRGCLMLQLTTDKQRQDAHRFYLALGFTASHEGMKLRLQD